MNIVIIYAPTVGIDQKLSRSFCRTLFMYTTVCAIPFLAEMQGTDYYCPYIYSLLLGKGTLPMMEVIHERFIDIEVINQQSTGRPARACGIGILPYMTRDLYRYYTLILYAVRI